MPEISSLGDSIQLIKGRVPKGTDGPGLHLLPYLTPEYLRGGSTIPGLFPATDKTVQVEDGEIIVLCDGSNAGEVFSAREGIVSSTMAVVKFDQRTIQRNFLFHYLKFYEPYLKAQTAGSGIPHLDKELLGLLPAIKQTEAAQTRIAAILTNLDQLISTTEALLDKQQRLRTGLLHDLLTRGLDQHGQLRSEETHEFKDSPLGRIPVEWEAKNLGSFLDAINGRAFKPSEWAPEGLPIIRIENLNNQTTPFNYCNFDVAEKYRVKDNDILISWSGTPGTSFGVFVWRRGDAVLNQHIFNIILDEAIIDKGYFVHAYDSIIQKMINESHGSGGLQHIKRGEFLAMLIPLPTLLDEQQNIAKCLDAHDTFVKNTKSRLSKLRRLKTGLMQDLLNGRVSVSDLDSLLPEA
jgi:type I restriction enzyme S subunit